MKKKLTLFVGALLLILAFCGFTYRSGNYVYDDTGNITEASNLNSRIAALRDTVKSDVVIVMTNRPTTSNYMQAAKDEVLKYVQATGGYGDNGQAILLYVDMENRRFAIVEHSTGKYLLKDSEIDAMTDSGSSLTTRLSSGDYNNACVAFLSYVEDYAKPGFFQTVFGWITAALGIGGAATGAAVGSHKARPHVSKRHYLNKNTFQTLQQDDIYTHTTQQVRQIQREEASPAHVSSGDLGDNVHGGGGSF
ncbi:MAG: TPM domain-containing protein [Lachnospiraceae bacterium]|nr:TPM domain-containing protein [Lachnospiraceae bacterium]